jgi:hypothetical protein
MRRRSVIYDFATPPSERKMTGREGEKGPCVGVNLQSKKEQERARNGQGSSQRKKGRGLVLRARKGEGPFKDRKGEGSF